MKAIRKLIQAAIHPESGVDDDIVEDAELELEAIETTFSEIAKLQQRILGDSKPIGGTANNKPISKCLCDTKHYRGGCPERGADNVCLSTFECCAQIRGHGGTST